MGEALRAGNKIKTKTMKVSTTPAVYEQLLLLVKTGLFGKNPSEVAEELLRDKLRDRIREGWTASTEAKRTRS